MVDIESRYHWNTIPVGLNLTPHIKYASNNVSQTLSDKYQDHTDWIPSMHYYV